MMFLETLIEWMAVVVVGFFLPVACIIACIGLLDILPCLIRDVRNLFTKKHWTRGCR